MKLARAIREQTGWPLAEQAVDENHYGVEMPDGRFLDAAGPHGNYQFKRYGPALVGDCPCGCQPDDGDRDAARRLLFTLGIHPEPEE
jgi:hypothetical protein